MVTSETPVRILGAMSIRLEHIMPFGVKFSLADIAKTLEVFHHWIEHPDVAHQVCIANVHTTMTAVNDPDFLAVNNSADLVTMDGMPLVWVARLLGYQDAQRVAGPDLLEAVCRVSVARGYRHFFYGGCQRALDGLVAKLKQDYPGIDIVGAIAPPFRPLTLEEEQSVVIAINKARPHFLWVGLGAPKQERWICSHRNLLGVPIQIGVGAAFDFLSGTVKRAPPWMQRSGLEWLFRLSQDPRRLWKRYVVSNFQFLLLAARLLVTRRLVGRRTRDC